MDDILIAGATTEQQLEKIDKMMSKLAAQGLCENKDKHLFFQKRVEFLGYIITPDGLSKAPQKVDTIADMSSPRDKVQLRSFIGLAQYYQRYASNLSTEFVPLTRMLR